MHKAKIPTFRRSAFALLILLISATGLLAAGGMNGDQPQDEDASNRPDLIMIDSLAATGPLKRPPVAFLHDKHTQILEKQNKDCSACHEKKDGRLIPKFKRTEDGNRQEVIEIYHDNCIACHIENADNDTGIGPITCGECHRKEVSLTSDRQPMGFDKYLHYLHVQAQENKCELCHHEYDAKTKKLFYAKGKEGTCRYCHKKETEENRISFRLAAHSQCIGCHRDKLSQGLHAGPIVCGGCHGPQAQQKLFKTLRTEMGQIPRMQRNQPDVVLMRAAAEAEPSEIPAERVAPVAFDHKAHEANNDTCRVCHHASMAACTSCHTSTGTKDGADIHLAQAMHQRDQKMSCIGCHAEKQRAPQCAGCHAAIQTGSTFDSATCKACHTKDFPEIRKPLTKEAAQSMAAGVISKRQEKTRMFAVDEIPEKVIIKRLSDQYEPVEMPHRKIVLKLVEKIKDDNIAGYFHTDPGTLCQGCHHHSPPSKTPPACGSCHGDPFDSGDPFRPGLMAAYHQQCFACHAEMGLPKPARRNCTACHLKKG